MRGVPIAVLAGCFFLSAIYSTQARVFTHCELAQELRRLSVPESQIPTWVCIAHYESRLNTSAVSGTGDHGIFQISEEYWCSPPGRGKACGLSCAELEDDNISNDVECVQTIFDEHQHLSGNGFNAWAVYPRCKKPSNVNRFIKKCTAGSIDNSIDTDTPLDLRFGSQPPYFSKPSYTPSQAFRTSANPFSQDYSSLVYNSNQDLSSTRASASPGYQDYSYKSVYSSQDLSSTRASANPFRQDYSFKYNPSQDLSSTRTSANPFQQDYSFKSVYNPSQAVTFTRASAAPYSQSYDSGRYNPFSYTTRRPTQVVVSSTVAPSVAYSPSIYSSSRPSSYSVGSIYYNPFETKSTTAAPVVYNFPAKSFGTSSFDSSRNLFGFRSTSAPPVYSSYTKKAAAIETSSPAPPLTKFKAPWADFPWWNGGK